MLNDKDLSTWQTFRRLWPMISPFKAGLAAAAIALIINVVSKRFRNISKNIQNTMGQVTASAELLAKNGAYAQLHKMQFGE